MEDMVSYSKQRYPRDVQWLFDVVTAIFPQALNSGSGDFSRCLDTRLQPARYFLKRHNSLASRLKSQRHPFLKIKWKDSFIRAI